MLHFAIMLHVLGTYRGIRELDIVSKAKGAGTDPLAVGPLSLDIGGIMVEVGPVVVGRALVGQRLGSPLVRLGRHGRHGRDGGCVLGQGV